MFPCGFCCSRTVSPGDCMSLGETVVYYLLIFTVAIVGGVCEDFICDTFNIKEQPNYAGADGHHIKLIDNPNATDPTYQELINFIAADSTDQKRYEKGVYVCSDYAEDIHNNAEAAGIKAAWVSVDFEDECVGHACNAFNTTDKGLVFIDCTESDSWAHCEIGEEYQPYALDFDISYTYYISMGVVSDIGIYW